MALQTSNHSVTAYFAQRSRAENAVEALKDAGFNSSQISLAVRPEYGEADAVSPTVGEKTEGVWNRITNFFEGNTSSGVFDKERNGPESASVVGEPVHGGYAYDSDDLDSSIREMNVPDQHARYFSHHFRQGEEGALVTVAAAGREAEAEQILNENSGDLGRNAAEFNYPDQNAGTVEPEAQRVQLFGEVLKVHKDRVLRGEATIRKNVVTENKTFEVPVTREELVITRHAVAGDTAGSPGSIGESREIRIPLSEERVTVNKHNVVLEEVSIGKRSVTTSQSVTDTVRHEELAVDEASAGAGNEIDKTRF